MNLKCVQFDRQKQHIDAFIQLAHQLYDKHNLTQNDTELTALLENNHVLSGDFKLYKFCVYDDQTIVGRFIFTSYDNDKIAYFGFFECVENKEIASFLFNEAEKFAKTKGFTKIVGPVDASFWLKYRLKTSGFEDAPYTGEPYNLPYYLDLFLNSGFTISEHYISSVYRALDKSYRNEKHLERFNDFMAKGYRIESPSLAEWDTVVIDVHRLINELYSDFPAYKPIDLASFKELFADYKKIVDTKMVKIAYYQDRAIGFYVSIPNYGNTVYLKRSLINVARIFKCRYFPQSYVMLYIGVEPAHKGIGSAMIQSIMEELKIKACPSIGALQRDGNKSQSYVNELIKKRYDYVLLEKDLT